MDQERPEFIIASFLNRYLQDQANGQQLSAEEYAQLFPEHTQVIAAELARLAEIAPGTRASSAKHPAKVPNPRSDPSESGSLGVLDNRYRLDALLGRGAQGVVYRATDLQMKRTVAIKALEGWSLLESVAVKNLQREAELASRLEHPGICRPYDVGLEGSFPFIVMQFVDGTPLNHLLGEESSSDGNDPLLGRLAHPETGPLVRTHLRIAVIVHLIAQIAEALHTAHEMGVVHRDLKPGNIIIDHQGRGVVLDFGIARDVASEDTISPGSHQAIGTVPYMSPEQTRGKDVDRRSDVWALGVLLYECLTHRRPFEGQSMAELTQAIRSNVAPPLQECPRAVRPSLRAIIDTALAKDPIHRFATADAVAQDLRRLLAGQPVRSQKQGALSKLTLWAKRKPAIAGLLLALALTLPILGAVSAYVWMTRDDVAAAQSAQAERALAQKIEDAFMLGAEGSTQESWDLLGEVLEVDPSNRLAILAHFADPGVLADRDMARALNTQLAPRIDSLPALKPIQETLQAFANGNEEKGPGDVLQSRVPDALEYYASGVYHAIRSSTSHQEPWALARRRFEQAIRVAPTAMPILHFSLTQANFSLGNKEGCRSMAAALESQWPDSRASLIWQGMAYLGCYEFELSIDRYLKAEEKRPLRASTLRALANAYINAKHFAKALPRIEDALKRNPKDPLAMATMSQYCKMTGDKSGAELWLRKSIAVRPGFFFAYGELARLIGQDKSRRKEAEQLAKKLMKAHPHGGQGQSALAYIASIHKRWSTVARWASHAVAKNKHSWRDWQLLAEASHSLGKTKEAEEAIAMAERFGSTKADVACCRGRIAQRKGRTDEALAHFEVALGHQADHIKSHSARARLLANSGQYERAIRLSEESLTLFPKSYNLLTIRWYCSNVTGKHLEALKMASRIREAFPLDKRSNALMGSSLFRLHRFEEALPFLKAAPKNDKTTDQMIERCGAAIAVLKDTRSILKQGISVGEERITKYADYCRQIFQHDMETKLYRLVFEKSPELLTNAKKAFGRSAAIAALQVALRNDPGTPLHNDYMELCLSWFDASLTALESAVETDAIAANRAEKIVVRWTSHPIVEQAIASTADSSETGNVSKQHATKLQALNRRWLRLME